jgi:hypothetical protein
VKGNDSLHRGELKKQTFEKKNKKQKQRRACKEFKVMNGRTTISRESPQKSNFNGF